MPGIFEDERREIGPIWSNRRNNTEPQKALKRYGIFHGGPVYKNGRTLGRRIMALRSVLVRDIGVRIPAPQPTNLGKQH